MVRLRYSKVHSADCEYCEAQPALLDRGAGWIESVYLPPAPSAGTRTARVRLGWRGAQKGCPRPASRAAGR